MANIDLTSNAWCELIFQDKNKAYGAYRMRLDSPKRHNLSMLIVVLIVAFAFCIPTLVRWATPKHREVITEVTTIAELEAPEVKQEEFKRVEKVAPPPQAVKSSIKFTAPVIKKDEEVPEEDEMKSQEELNTAKAGISIADVKGNDEINGQDIADLKEIVVQGTPKEEPVFDMVEQMPSFPGGQEELMRFLAKNIHYPAIAQENGISGKVICQFVVSSDGTVKNIQVLRQLDPSCDKEAVRVLSLMPKWIPGKQNGKPVAVKYTVPIVFRLQ